jgi:MFS family permease
MERDHTMSVDYGRGRHNLFQSITRALAHRNFRLFFIGQTISMIGGWMTRVATGWLVFRLGGSNSVLLLGLVSFASQAPALFLAPFAGVLVDRWNRHRLLVVTQTLFMVESGLLALVAFSGASGAITIGLILALSLFEGLVNAFDMPARQAFLAEMVPAAEDRANAVALNSSLVNGARLVGPSVAGGVIAAAGEGWCFAADAVSSVAIIGALLAMRLAAPERKNSAAPAWHDLMQGFRYAFSFAPIRSILLLVALVSLMGIPYAVLMPVFAADVLGGGPSTLGLLTAASGAGAVAGALYLASRTYVLGLGRVIVVATCVFGAALVGFVLSQLMWLSFALQVLIGFGMMVQMAASNMILQTIVDEDKRGRVMSFYGMAFLGMSPFGSVCAGVVTGRVGVTATVLMGAIACLLGVALFEYQLPRLRSLVRPIYVGMGIVPEIATGMQAGAECFRPPKTDDQECKTRPAARRALYVWRGPISTASSVEVTVADWRKCASRRSGADRRTQRTSLAYPCRWDRRSPRRANAFHFAGNRSPKPSGFGPAMPCHA